MRPRPLSPILLAVLAGCALGGPRPPAPLDYRVPTPDTLVYVAADTARVEMDAGGRSYRVEVASAATWAMAFEPVGGDGGGVRVTATLQALEGTVDNPVTGASRADASGVEGPLVFTLGPRGRATLERQPTVEGSARRVFSAASVVHDFFPGLPGGPVPAGATWADTVTYAMDEADGKVSARVTLTYVAAGDTLVDGRRHLRVRFQGREERRVRGDAGGAEYVQEVAGTVEGAFLWDRERSALASLERSEALSGTMTVPSLGAPLPVRVRAVTRIGLQGAG